MDGEYRKNEERVIRKGHYFYGLDGGITIGGPRIRGCVDVCPRINIGQILVRASSGLLV